GGLDANNPLKKALSLLAPNLSLDQLILEGTLPGAIMGLGGPSGLAGLSLRANLPEINPDADWLVGAHLAISITGRPSVGFAGEMTVKAKDDLLTFMTEINIAVVPTGVELGLLGALETEKPWVAPLGVKWLTLNDLRLKTAINPIAVKFGFLGRFKIGEKDIEVIAMLPINYYTGVPTGLGLQGASDEGVALSDIADLQNAMARAAGRSQPKLPIDELPNIAVKDLDFRFSTLNDPDLDLKIGTTFGGQLWIEMEPNEMQNFAGILFDVGLDGIIGKAHLGNISVGPVEWRDALLDVTVTLPDRHLIIDGGLDLGFASGRGRMQMAKRKMTLDADVSLLGNFRCALSGSGEMGLGTSNLTLHGALQSDFGGAVSREVLDGLKAIGNGDGGAVSSAAQAAVDRAEALAAERGAALDVARAVIAKTREVIVAERDETKREMDQARSAMDGAQRRANAAYQRWQDTPRREVGTRAERWKENLKAQAVLDAAKVVHAGKRSSYTAKAAAYNALKPIDSYPRVQELLAAANAAKQAAQQRREELQQMKENLKSIAASVLPQSVTVRSAEFTTKLARARQGGAVDMKMVLDVDGTSVPMELQWTFGQMKENAAAILAQLVSRIRKS
ncbi:MAG: hypothetical protein AAB011_03025, partial [Candidatus Eisenbacteria bacterium]